MYPAARRERGRSEEREMSLVARRLEHETWRDAVQRIGKKYGLEQEAVEFFEAAKSHGDTDAEAAHSALYEWDSMDFEP